MKNIQGMVSDAAKDVLVDYQKTKGFNQQREALEDLLMKFDDRLTEAQAEEFIRRGAEVMISCLSGDLLIPPNLDRDAVVAEVLRRQKDPMSDPKPLSTMIEGERDDRKYSKFVRENGEKRP